MNAIESASAVIQEPAIRIRLYPDGRLDTKDAAAYVGLSDKTLANLRCKGTGPRFVKRGKIFYFKDDLDAWLGGGAATSTAQARFQNRQGVAGVL